MTLNLRNAMLACLTAATLVFAGGGFVTPISSSAQAQSASEKSLVDAAKARGQVGEQGDGYLGFVVPSTDPALAAAVAAINSGRMQAYRDTAMRTGVTADAAGQATAQQLFSRLLPGQYFKPLNGDWTRKN